VKNQEQINSPLTVAQLSEIQKLLPFGAQRVLANKHQCSDTYVSKVLKGQRDNDFILDDAILMAEAEKKKKADREKRLQQRVKKLTV